MAIHCFFVLADPIRHLIKPFVGRVGTRFDRPTAWFRFYLYDIRSYLIFCCRLIVSRTGKIGARGKRRKAFVTVTTANTFVS
jgi:hypothetical protein